MNNRRVKLGELQLMKAFGVERLSPVLWERVLRDYNPWTAPLAALSEPEGAVIVDTTHLEFPL